ncbi:MAG: DNA alkylation repair protein [Bacteroidales bacterium]|nr:DNA alkylation repair protein [Bacteroidales bacterium]
MSLLQGIKKQFMAFRNGVVADTLRAGGLSCYSIIFGLNLPQLKQIAEALRSEHTPEELRTLADALLADRGVRESRLLAYHLYGMLPLTDAEARQLAADVQTREEVEILCLRVLRNHPAAPQILDNPGASTPDLQQHLQAILTRHLNP